MTPDERNLLSQFLRDLEQARAGTKDGEADGMIARTLTANPDAAYLLVQHTIVADQSLHAAQARIAELEAQVRSAAPAQPTSSFLPSGGMSGPWGGRPAEPMPVDERPSAFSGGGGLGSFLRSAGTTAAGVAGGELLFSGLSDLFGGHRGGGFFGGGGYGNGPEEVIVNNYNDDGDDFSDDSNNW
jgi:hypothetical protein